MLGKSSGSSMDLKMQRLAFPFFPSTTASLYHSLLLLFPCCLNLYSYLFYSSSSLSLSPFFNLSIDITSLCINQDSLPPSLWPIHSQYSFPLVRLFIHLYMYLYFTRSISPVGQSGRIKSKVLYPPNELIRPWRDEKRGEKNIKKVLMGLYWRQWVRISQYLVDYLISVLIRAKWSCP